jgi:hypothetical protein
MLQTIIQQTKTSKLVDESVLLAVTNDLVSPQFTQINQSVITEIPSRKVVEKTSTTQTLDL